MVRTWIGLLRGINVGKAKRVAMADLRASMESLGYGDVRTLLASGNVVFTSGRALPRDATDRMEQALVRATGVSSRFTVLSADELRQIVEANPLAKQATDPSRMFVGFLQAASDTTRLASIGSVKTWTPDALAIGKRAVYVWCPNGQMESKLFEAIGKALGDRVTVRNWGTTTKLLGLATQV
ncbi:MAG TPA: DUF1697 domain-containing protein [Gemmatimonadaceae bacterium]